MDRRRLLSALGALLIVGSPLALLEGAGQNGNSARGAWTAPRTPDGQPNLEGDWTNDTYTPLERPAELGDKEFFTPDEAAAFVKSRTERLLAQSKNDVHYDDAIWQTEKYGKQATLRTSLIVHPRNGKLPALTVAAGRRLPQQLAAQRAGSSDSARNRSLAERCISWGNVGPPMIPPTYAANLQILQTRDQVIIRHELMDGLRIVYLDGRPHPSPHLQWLAGHSTGRWDGQTLVVDTTNFTDATNFRGSPQNTRQDIFATARLHVVERLTPVERDTLHYEFTVDDPETWTTPWSGEMAIRRIEGPIYEYACHEGNYGLANILRGARVAESR